MESTVWVPNKERCWEIAKIVSSATENLVVEGSDGSRRTVLRSETHLVDESHLQCLDDLCIMNSLHDAPLLDMLRRRFLEDKIYTYTADVLISVNPYKTIPKLYDSPLKYLTAQEDDDDEDNVAGAASPARRTTAPHVWQVTDNALCELSRECAHNQSIIISGESGAGKTEAAKYAMQFLISANEATCALAEVARNTDDDHRSLGSHMKQVLLHSSVVFEAFGNAKTVRNDNSSRFGKLIKLQYTSDNLLVSATTETFLLEKSRLVAVGAGERNYHVFYQLLAGLATTKHVVGDFKILTEGGVTVITTEAADKEEFSNLQIALIGLGCTSQELDALWCLLIAVMHLGNTTSVAAGAGGVGAPTQDDSCSVVCSSTTMSSVANVLGVDEAMFLDCLRTQTLKAGRRGSTSKKILSQEDTQNNIFALLKFIYGGIFTWMLEKVNAAHAAGNGSFSDDSRLDSKKNPVTKKNPDKFIGILDIFGFEILQKNSFEQLCINFANERLQQQFNEHIFVLEQEEYASEGLNWSSITYRDNQPVIELIGKKPFGLLHILEEHSILNRKPDDIALGNSFVSCHAKAPNSVHPAFSKSRFGNDGFLVRHFAGEVQYELDGFISKNNDSLQEDLLEFLSMSENSFLRAAVGLGSLEPHEVGYLPRIAAKMQANVTSTTRSSSSTSNDDTMSDSNTNTQSTSTSTTTTTNNNNNGHKMASAVTVSYRFREQLDQLSQTLKSTTPHYIKCIKSNANKSAYLFSGPLVLEQLRYSGVVEVVRIRREGYPSRLDFKSFYDKHKVLAFKNCWLDSKDPTLTDAMAKQYCQTLAAATLPAISFQTGHTRIFLRDGALDLMQQAIIRFLSGFATKIQAKTRCVLETKKFKKRLHQIVVAQTALRMLYARKKFTVHVAKRKADELKVENERRRLEAIRIRQEQERLEEERIAKLEHEARVAALAEKAQREQALREAQMAASQKIQRIAKAFFQRRSLLKKAAFLHRAAANGDVQAIKSAVSQDLALLLPPRYRTLQHTALTNNQVGVLKALGWSRPVGHSAQSVLSMIDAQGDGVLHLACMASPVLKSITISALSEAADALIPPPKISRDNVNTVGKDKILVSSEGNNQARDKPLKTGWLSKRKEGNSYRRRWCVLTQDTISYFKLPGDSVPKGVVPLLGCTFRRVSGPNLPGACFTLTSPHIKKASSFFGMVGGSATNEPQVMYFMADSEAELLQWIAPTRAVLGVEPLRPGKLPSYVRPTSRGKVLNVGALNKKGQTALHILCSTPSKATAEFEDELFTVASWLVSMGCPLDVKCAGKTANIVATENGHLALGAFLQKVLQSGHAPGAEQGLLSRPVVFKGYSYLSITFLSQRLEQGAGPIFSPSPSSMFLAVELVSSTNGTALEAAQRVTVLSHRSSDGKKVWWGSELFIQSPLENLEEMAVIKVRLTESSGGGKVIAETAIKLCKRDIESGRNVLELLAPYGGRIHSTLLIDLQVQCL